MGGNGSLVHQHVSYKHDESLEGFAVLEAMINLPEDKSQIDRRLLSHFLKKRGNEFVLVRLGLRPQNIFENIPGF